MTDTLIITEPTTEPVVQDTPPVEEPVKNRTQPRWLEEATADVKRLKTFAGHAQRMIDRDANETDTRLLVTDVLTEALGWDKYTDVSTEYQVRGEFADYALRVDNQLFAMVEVKRAAQNLTERHLRQIESYGLREGADWLILTNGMTWKVYRLITPIAGNGTKPEHVFSVDLNALTKADLDHMLGLHKQAVKRGHIEALWKKHSALCPQNLDAVLLSARVVNAVRLEVKATVGYNADDAEVKAAVRARLEG